MKKQALYSGNFKIKDHSVSGEEFQLIENSEYGFLETRPKPSEKQLPDYYESEDYISHTDSKRNLFEKIYHSVRSFSLKKKLNLINGYSSKEKTLLDIGCGTGDFLETAFKKNWKVFGIEPNQQARTIANNKVNNSVFETNQLLKFKSQSFDIITLWHVLEHLPNLEEQISIFKTLLKPNGTLIIAVPNFDCYDAKYYREFWAAFDVPRHLWHFNRESMSKLFLKFNFKIIKTKPMWFDAFYVSMLSEKYKSGKIKPFKGFWIGLISNISALFSKEASSIIYVIKNSKTRI